MLFENMNRMKIYAKSMLLAGVFMLVGSWQVMAQNKKDAMIFQAMQDEMQRNMEKLHLPGNSKPFFLDYTLKFNTNFEIAGSLGSIINSIRRDSTAVGSVRLLVGDYHRSNDFRYDGAGHRISIPSDGDYNLIRHQLWMATDAAYKDALQQYVGKMGYLKNNPLSPEEEQIDDRTQQEVTCRATDKTAYQLDEKVWKERIAKLSAIFLRYPKLQNTTVVMHGLASMTYKTTSEGLKLQVPDGQVTIVARASVLGTDMVRINDSWSITVSTPEELPEMVDLEKQITAFAEGLIHLAQLEPVKEYYAGPVLFADAACMNVFTTNLLQPGQLVAYRRPAGSPAGNTFDGRFERKIIDSRLTVKNLTALKSYNGTPLLGHYDLDAEGIAPAKELTLIENGILRKQLNGRIPTLKAPLSTGSTRFALTPDQVYAGTAPGVLHISCSKGLKMEKMKQALRKSAREENLPYAYIIRKMAGQASLVYRVDTQTGEETQVRAGELANIDLMKLKRLTAISAQEQVSNYLYNTLYPSSLIYPKAILVEDVEINAASLRKEERTPLVFPLERQ